MLVPAKSVAVMCVSVLVTMFCVDVSASPLCSNLFEIVNPAAFNSNTIRQLHEWEIIPLLEGSVQPRAESRVRAVNVPKSSVEIVMADTSSAMALEQVLGAATETIPYLQHPYNQDSRVPHFGEPTQFFTRAKHTASRSLLVELKGRVFSVKLPTDYPMGSTQYREGGKSNMVHDAWYSIERTKLIMSVDKNLQPDPHFVVLKEVLSVIDRQTKNGYVFRDMSSLREDKYYLPAHALPVVGKEIASKQDADYHRFWSKHWAARMGVVQARLLIRYGLEPLGTNPQNYLIELDKALAPTGRIFWRDVADSTIVIPIASRIGLSKAVEADLAHDKGDRWGVRERVRADNETLTWLFPRDVKSWRRAHDEAYAKVLKQELGFTVTSGRPLSESINEDLALGDQSMLLKAIVRWHRNHR